MLSLRLGIDIDGVLADFTSGYLKMLQSVSGREGFLKPGEEPNCWLWATKYGFTKDQDLEAWDRIKSDPTFWYRLPHAFEAPSALATLMLMYTAGYEVFFLTDRPGVHPHMQTVGWLTERGMLLPQVIVAEKKGPVAAALGFTHFIDDKPKNCFDVKAASPATTVFLLRKPYNDTPEYNQQCGALGIVILTSLRAFFDTIAAEEKTHAIVV